MRLYPTIPRRRMATIASDVGVVFLLALFAWLGFKVHDTVAELAAFGRGIQEAGTSVGTTAVDAADAVRGGFESAAGAVEATPVVGDRLADALRSTGERGAAPVERRGQAQAQRLVDAGRDGEQRALATAHLLGWLTFLTPAILLLSRAIPPRVRQARTLGAAERVLTGDGLDRDRERALAARAAFSLPYATLQRHTEDPFGDLIARRHHGLIRALGEDAGLWMRGGSRTDG
jgi:hypothetical protein